MSFCLFLFIFPSIPLLLPSFVLSIFLCPIALSFLQLYILLVLSGCLGDYWIKILIYDNLVLININLIVSKNLAPV